ncbi:unnamed protein product, partial [Laminaria digitata]
MLDFTYQAFKARIVFGPGKVSELPAEIENLGARSVLVISTGSQRAVADTAIDALGSDFAARIDGAVMHVPRENVDSALDLVRQHACDCVIAIGGGSALGVAKGIALETGLPIVAVPSTYAGSEMTDIWGISEGDGKTTGRDERVVPKTVIYDPD